MNRLILWCVLLIVGIVGLRVTAEEGIETCDLNSPHVSAQYCLSHKLTSREEEDCCTAVCMSCHTAPQELADLCFDCHKTKFIEKINHPVEIAYEPDNDSEELIVNPQGPKLVCVSRGDASGDVCLIRCVTCHKVHPVESEGNQLQGLLRVSSIGSALCLRCHIK